MNRFRLLNFLVALASFALSLNSLEAQEWLKDERYRFSQIPEEERPSETILEYPELDKFLFRPPKAPVYLGVGMSPLSLMSSKVYLTLNLFQMHRITDRWDLELFSASVGQVLTSDDFAKSKHFTIRSSFKYVFMDIFETGKVSFGPVVGFEAVQFSNIQYRKSKILTGDTQPTTSEPQTFSTYGPIYGAVLSETFRMKKNRLFKVSQYLYRQNYFIDEIDNDWEIAYQNDELTDATVLEENKEKIQAGWVFLLEFSFLF